MQRALAISLLLGLCLTARALDFELVTQTKCVYEEINANVIVVGDYKAYNKDNPSLPVNVDVLVRPVARRLVHALRQQPALLHCSIP